MNAKTQYWITNKVKIILDRTMTKEFPDLNTHKIAEFYTTCLKWTLDLTSTIILILTFTWYLPTYYRTTPETSIIILLCILILTKKE